MSCPQCGVLRAACDTLRAEKKALAASIEINDDAISTSQLKLLLQEILAERSQYEENIKRLQAVIDQHNQNGNLMEQKVDELTNSIEKERKKIYTTVKANLETLHNSLGESKEKIMNLQAEKRKNEEETANLKAQNADLTRENEQLKKTLEQFSTLNIGSGYSSDELIPKAIGSHDFIVRQHRYDVVALEEEEEETLGS